MTSTTGSVWSEHQDPSGNKYFYNHQTGVSTYDIPPEFASTDVPADGWVEYKDEASSKPYYYNVHTKQSVWEEPESLRVHKARLEAEKLGLAVTVNRQGKSQSSRMRKVSDEAPETSPLTESYDHLSQKERVDKFKEFLMEMNITSKMKWPETQKQIQMKPEYGLLKALGERKQAFAEYLTTRRKYEQQQQRSQAKLNRENFMKMLAATKEIGPGTKWDEAADMLRDDERFEAVADEYDRRELFHDFVLELVRNEREFREKQRAKLKQDFQELMVSLSSAKHRQYFKQNQQDDQQSALKGNDAPAGDDENEFNLDASSRFSGPIKSLIGRDERFREIDFRELEQWFYDFVDLLRENEKKIRQNEHDQRLNRVKSDLEQLEKQLHQDIAERKINHTIKWNNYQEILLKTPANEQLWAKLEECDAVGLFRSIFDKEIDRVYDSYQHVKRSFLNLLQRADEKEGTDRFEFEDNTTFDEFCEVLSTEDKSLCTELTEKYPIAAQDAFDFIKEQTLSRRKAREEALQRRMVDFVDLLTEYYYRSDHLQTTWEEAERELSNRSAFRGLDSDLRKKVFISYMDKLQGKMKECTQSRKELEAQVDAVNSAQPTSKPKSSSRKKKHRRSRSRSSSHSSDSESEKDDRYRSKHRSRRRRRSRSYSSDSSSDEDRRRRKSSSRKKSKSRKKSSSKRRKRDSSSEPELGEVRE